MEVLTDSDSPHLISNVEVLEMLSRKIQKRKEKEEKQKRKNKNNKNQLVNNKFQHRDWIEQHVYDYLLSTPCKELLNDTSKVKELQSKLMSCKKQQNQQQPSQSSQQQQPDASTAASILPSESSTTTTTTITGFGLTEAESIQLLNFMPREPVEIHIMVEELHARMSETRQQELLELIDSYRQNKKNYIEEEQNEIVVEEEDDNNLLPMMEDEEIEEVIKEEDL